MVVVVVVCVKSVEHVVVTVWLFWWTLWADIIVVGDARRRRAGQHQT